MTKAPPSQPTALRTVLDTVGTRSAFGLNSSDRYDRFRLIEAARKVQMNKDETELYNELIARRTETILAIVTLPSPDFASFEAKMKILGLSINFPETSESQFTLLSAACSAALIMDGNSVGALSLATVVAVLALDAVLHRGRHRARGPLLGPARRQLRVGRHQLSPGTTMVLSRSGPMID